jgi:hypothetical protein
MHAQSISSNAAHNIFITILINALSILISYIRITQFYALYTLHVRLNYMNRIFALEAIRIPTMYVCFLVCDEPLGDCRSLEKAVNTRTWLYEPYAFSNKSISI